MIILINPSGRGSKLMVDSSNVKKKKKSPTLQIKFKESSNYKS